MSGPTGSRGRVATVVVALAASLLLLFLLAPVGVLAARGSGGLGSLVADAELREALGLTVACATAATVLAMLLGTPVAWLLSRRRFRGRALVSAALDLPLLIPHPVAGIALLLVLGRGTPLGDVLAGAGIRLVSSPLGIILAMLFVSASLYVSGAREAFARVSPRYETVAQTLGDSPLRAFRRVTLPLAARGIVAAAVVSWARAVSEFGAVVVLAHTPRTVSVLAWDRFTTFGLTEALPVAGALVLLALVPLTLLRALRGDEDAIRMDET